jgi:hypothetical protein
MKLFVWLSVLAIVMLNLTSVTAQESNVAITLERTACFGTCPVYTVRILEDGTVIYNGQDFVAVTGEQTGEIDPATVEAMVAEFAEAGYFEWDAEYMTQTVTDLPTIITSVTRNGETHRITRYAGDASAPLALGFLEQWVDAMANTTQWTGVQPDPAVVSNGTDTPIITLQRGPCFGFCPVYNVALYADGTAVYTGIANVDNLGVQVFEVDSEAITSVAHRAQLSGFFDWQDSYEDHLVTDQATFITMIRWEDQYKRIVRYDGDPNAPIGLVRVENSIDQVVTDAMA